MRQALESEVATKLDAYTRDIGIVNGMNICPICRTTPGVRGNQAWQCVACRAFVYCDPLVPNLR